MPIYPVLSEMLGDVRDTSPTRIIWLQKKAAGMEGSEVMERIMGLFGLEGFKKHCLSLYERIVSVPAPLRPSEAGNVDIFIEGSEGAGQDLAALRYRELLVSLQVIPRPSLIHYFTEEPASIATALQTVKKTLTQNVDSPSKKSVEEGPSGDVISKTVERIIRGHSYRGAWQQWTTLESSARMLRQRRLRPYWTTTGAITISALESAGHYYGSCHLLGETPREVRARVSEYEQLMQMVGLDGVKADVTALIEREQWNQQQRLDNNETRLSRYQRAALHRCFVGPPGTGRRTVAKLYARILWRLGLVEGMETVTLSLASLIGLTRQAIERHVHKAFTDTKNVGVVIVEDICIDGLRSAVQETSNNAKREKSDEEDSNGDEQDDGSDIDAIHDKIPRQAVRHRNHEMRPFVFDLLTKRVKTLDVQDTGPVLVLVGLATQSAGANLAHLPLQLTDSKRDMDSSHASISSSLRQLFLSTTQIISLKPYSVEELSLLLQRRLSRKHGQPWPMNKAELRDAMRIERLRPSFDNICFVERVALHPMGSETPRGSALDDKPSDEGDNWHRRSESSSSTVPSKNDAKIAQRPSGRASSSPTVGDLFGLGPIADVFETIDTTATHLTQGQLEDPRPHVPYLFLFSGPPGSGKTSVLNKVLVPLYFTLGLVDKQEIVSCNTSELMYPRSQSNVGNRLDHTKDITRVSEVHVKRMMALAFGKVLHIRGHRTTGDTRHLANDNAEDPTACRDKILTYITELLEADNHLWTHNLIVVFEEDSATSEANNASAASLATGLFTHLRFPAISTASVILSILQKKVATAFIELPLLWKPKQTSTDSNPDAVVKRRLESMLEQIAQRPAFSGRELDVLAKDIVRYTYSQLMPHPLLADKTKEGDSSRQPDPICLKVSHLIEILYRRYTNAIPIMIYDPQKKPYGRTKESD
ncbi:hypothetical protein SPBR_01278 [Sporothrix brasiliensis 5110]|uniref:AAA+ ATPase domain-containing protein n=1 Tax=Sporothrix brasiliensis 5110 TaxID=1398154 RepID=A0A0C2IQI3_9PEZI|nr:uncharacterized protein SPBR_01278 [Sporothrix brasiliensis 5110]KIH91301.1 hypothetical protein SPBR_01278 [Sporothrix brasiliensis 5110]